MASRYARRERDFDYLARVRSLPCLMASNDFCEGPIEAHHAGQRGLGQKADDRTAVPLCRRHHACWHSASGPFRYLKKHDRRAWAEAAIATTLGAMGEA